MKATLIDHMGADLTTVNAARVSFAKKSEWLPEAECPTDPVHGGKIPPYKRLSDKDAKLIKYLGEHEHYSPFGHCFATVHVKAPIFVARQLVKHEYLRMNEVSRRYVDSDPEFYVPEVWRGKSKDKKQGSEGTVKTYNTTAIDLWHDDCLKYYKMLIDDGVAPEQARMVLPLSTYTEWYWSGSMDAFANMVNLRCKEDTQYETRLIANQIDKMLAEVWPVSWSALREGK